MSRTAPPPDVRALEAGLESALDRSKLHVAASRRRSLAEYVALLAQWSRAYNLTAVRDPSR